MNNFPLWVRAVVHPAGYIVSFSVAIVAAFFGMTRQWYQFVFASALAVVLSSILIQVTLLVRRKINGDE